MAIIGKAEGRWKTFFRSLAEAGLRPESWLEGVLNPILVEWGIREKLKRLGVLRYGNYAFRQMNITELRRMNVPLKTIQKRVGHVIGSDVTDEHYVHAIDADDRPAVDRIGALLASNTQEARRCSEIEVLDTNGRGARLWAILVPYM